MLLASFYVALESARERCSHFAKIFICLLWVWLTDEDTCFASYLAHTKTYPDFYFP